MNQKLFNAACEKIIDKERERKQIGVLAEKTVHAVLKNYIEPNTKYHEIRMNGYVADIAREDEIIEIQTRNFNTLRRKLDVFLEQSFVTIVYPIPYVKWMCWLDEQTGEVTKPRKSPKKGSPYMAFFELYKIKSYLTHPNLRIHIILMNVEETRVLNGWSLDKKKGSTRYDRIPLEIVEEIFIDCAADYQKLIPNSMIGEFTSKEYGKETKLSTSAAQTALNVLYSVGAVKRIGKTGRSYIYTKPERATSS
ncbi:MAG: hypothetical protein ACERKN_18910 [Velocimicrobium sp.]